MTASRTNDQWVAALRVPGPDQEAALAELHGILLMRLPYALSRWLAATDSRRDAFIEDVAQETLLRVLDRLETFEGRSQFLTWVYKISVRIALGELRRKRWENVSLDGLLEDEEHPLPERIVADPRPTPAAAAEGADLVAKVRNLIAQELTQKQREALLAMGMHGLPMDEVARRMGTNRNALYKLLHDARLRLKQRLAREGLTPEEILGALERSK